MEANTQHLRTDDLCHDVSKYLQVKSTCKKPQEKIVCEQGIEMLTCPYQEYIIIHKAYYGRDNKRDGRKCQSGRDTTSTCNSSDVTRYVKQRQVF